LGDPKINWDDLALELRGEVLEGIKPYVEASEEDLRTYGTLIALDLVRAAREGNEALLSELGHQLQGLAEIHRIRTVNASWAQIERIVALVGRVAMKAIAAAVI
jgi:hypothetical protein